MAAYREGRFDFSAEAFERAASLGDADLAASAMYNEGTARYANALERLNQPEEQSATTPQGNEEPSEDPIQEAIERVSNALTHFKDASAARPGNTDARVNAELATRLLKQLKEYQEQQQDQKRNINRNNNRITGAITGAIPG